MKYTITNTSGGKLMVGRYRLDPGASVTVTGVAAVRQLQRSPQVHTLHQQGLISVTISDDGGTKHAPPFTPAVERIVNRAPKSVFVRLGDLDAGGVQEHVVFTTSVPVFITRFSMACTSGVSADANNYTTLTFFNKGTDGSGNDAMIVRRTQTGAANLITFNAFKPNTIGSGANLSNRRVAAGGAVSLVKADTGQGQALPGCVVRIDYVYAGRIPDMSDSAQTVVNNAELP